MHLKPKSSLQINQLFPSQIILFIFVVVFLVFLVHMWTELFQALLLPTVILENVVKAFLLNLCQQDLKNWNLCPAFCPHAILKLNLSCCIYLCFLCYFSFSFFDGFSVYYLSMNNYRVASLGCESLTQNRHTCICDTWFKMIEFFRMIDICLILSVRLLCTYLFYLNSAFVPLKK